MCYSLSLFPNPWYGVWRGNVFHIYSVWFCFLWDWQVVEISFRAMPLGKSPSLAPSFPIFISVCPQYTLKTISFYLFTWLCWVLVATRRIFTAVCGLLSSCGLWVLLPHGMAWHGMWDPSSPTRDWTCVPCVGRQTLTHWTTREVPDLHFGMTDAFEHLCCACGSREGIFRKVWAGAGKLQE